MLIRWEGNGVGEMGGFLCGDKSSIVIPEASIQSTDLFSVSDCTIESAASFPPLNYGIGISPALETGTVSQKRSDINKSEGLILLIGKWSGCERARGAKAARNCISMATIECGSHRRRLSSAAAPANVTRLHSLRNCFGFYWTYMYHFGRNIVVSEW